MLHIDAYHTDLFDTFTGDADRAGNQLEAAIAKARKGMEIGNTKIGIASEGLFTTDPYAGMFPWNNEIVILIDDERDIQIVGFAANNAQSYSAFIRDTDDLDEHLKKAKFPKPKENEVIKIFFRRSIGDKNKTVSPILLLWFT